MKSILRTTATKPLFDTRAEVVPVPADSISLKRYFKQIGKQYGDYDERETIEMMLLLVYQSQSPVTFHNIAGRPVFPPRFMESFFKSFSTNKKLIEAFSDCYHCDGSMYESMIGGLRMDIDDYCFYCNIHSYEDSQVATNRSQKYLLSLWSRPFGPAANRRRYRRGNWYRPASGSLA
jgi:hypothetical protein